MIDTKTIDLAKDKHYSEFSEKIKKMMGYKMAHHEIAKTYSGEMDEIEKMKAAFSAVNKQ